VVALLLNLEKHVHMENERVVVLIVEVSHTQPQKYANMVKKTAFVFDA